MSTTVLPELAAESLETAERLIRLSAEVGLDLDEAEYILTSGLEALQRASQLWLIVRGRIGSGMIAASAHRLVARLLEAVGRNLVLAGDLKKLAQVVHTAGAELDAAEERLLAVQAKAARLLAVIDTPARWPDEEQLKEAKESLRRGERLTAEQFRQAQLGE